MKLGNFFTGHSRRQWPITRANAMVSLLEAADRIKQDDQNGAAPAGERYTRELLGGNTFQSAGYRAAAFNDELYGSPALREELLKAFNPQPLWRRAVRRVVSRTARGAIRRLH